MSEEFGKLQQLEIERLRREKEAAELAVEAASREEAKRTATSNDRDQKIKDVSSYIANELAQNGILPDQTVREEIEHPAPFGLPAKKEVNEHRGWLLTQEFGSLREAAMGSDQYVGGTLLDASGSIMKFGRTCRVQTAMNEVPKDFLTHTFTRAHGRFSTSVEGQEPSIIHGDDINETIISGLVKLATINDISLEGF